MYVLFCFYMLYFYSFECYGLDSWFLMFIFYFNSIAFVVGYCCVLVTL